MGDRIIAKLLVIELCVFFAAFVAVKRVVTKDVMVPVPTCASCVWWINGER